MVALFNHCTFNLNPRAASIDTPLHGFVPHTHVDHVHADAVIAIAASENAEALTQEAFDGELGFLPWQRPGFDLGLKLGAMAEAKSEAQGRRARRPRPVHLGADLEDLLRDNDRHDQQGRPPGSQPTRRAPAFGGEAMQALAARAAARDRGTAHARDPRAHLSGRAQDRPLRRRAGSAGVRQFARSEAARRARHLLPRSFPAHENPARWCCRSIPQR